MIILNEDLASLFKKPPNLTVSETQWLFAQMMSLKGDIFRAEKGRCTQRLQLGDQFYFIKQHTGVGWKEIIKNMLQLRLPVISAKNEWKALHALHNLNVNVPSVMGHGQEGCNPATRQSFIVTKELPPHISLEDYCRDWITHPPGFVLKKAIIENAAELARTLHENGINHRDFYICHVLLDRNALAESQIKLYLIDLHRAGMRSKIPLRWRIKDLGGLYFSSKEIGLTKKDLLRFIKKYRNKSLHDIVSKESLFWLKVKTRGDKLYGKHKK